MDENKNLINNNEEVIVVDEGIKRIRVQNNLGEEIGVFLFNPTDFNIVNRYREIQEQFKDVVKPLENINIDANGESDDDRSIELLNEAEEKMIELMDYMLRCDSREAFFKTTHLFTPIDGVFYCENVLNAIGEFISRKFDAEIERVDSRVSKHTHGYRTGKHKRGDR